jgi:hypothetical protein
VRRHGESEGGPTKKNNFQDDASISASTRSCFDVEPAPQEKRRNH